MIDDTTSGYAIVLKWGGLAGFGGAVKYVSAVIRSTSTISKRHFVMLLSANIFISSFCGLMGGLLTTLLTKDQAWPFLASGIFGYLGTQGLDIVILTMKKKLEPNASMASVIPVPPELK